MIKKQNCLLVLVMVVFPLVLTYIHNSPYPPFAQCRQDIISKIKEYPTSNSSSSGFQPGDRYYMLYTSYDYKNEDNECVYIKTEGPRMFATFVPKSGGTAGVLDYTTWQNEDGSIFGRATDEKKAQNQQTWILHLIDQKEGVIVNYSCSDEGDPSEEPLVEFWMSKKAYHDPEMKSYVDKLYERVKTWGFKFSYTYGDKCFSSVNNRY